MLKRTDWFLFLPFYHSNPNRKSKQDDDRTDEGHYAYSIPFSLNTQNIYYNRFRARTLRMGFDPARDSITT